jgi:hypothetical protein
MYHTCSFLYFKYRHLYLKCFDANVLLRPVAVPSILMFLDPATRTILKEIPVVFEPRLVSSYPAFSTVFSSSFWPEWKLPVRVCQVLKCIFVPVPVCSK